MQRTTDIAIIGAGPYGLSISAHLRNRNIAHEIFGRPMSSWRDFMPTGMVLRSEAHASNLWDPQRLYTLERYCQEKRLPYKSSGPPVPIGQFLDYTEWFQRRAVPEVQDQLLRRLSQSDGGFDLNFANGDRIRARNVIIATGHRFFRNIPASLAGLPRQLLSHSSDHKDLTPLQGKDVIIIGAGQSSLETAALLHEQGTNVRIVARRGQITWNRDNSGDRGLLEKVSKPEAGLGIGWRSVVLSEMPLLFTMLPRGMTFEIARRTQGPSGAWWLKPRVAGTVPVLASCDIISARELDNKAHLRVRCGSTIEELTADHIIAATGFRPDVNRLPFVDPHLLAGISTFRNVPRLTRHSESSVPGLFFAGLLAAPTFGPVMRFMFGAKHSAPNFAQRFSENTQLVRPPLSIWPREADRAGGHGV